MAPVKRFYVPTGGHKLIDIYRAMRDSFEQTIGNLDPSWYEDSPEQMPIDLDDNETWTSFNRGLAALRAWKPSGWQAADRAPTQARGCRQKSHLRSPLQAWSA